jgi:hypothetical protein
MPESLLILLLAVQPSTVSVAATAAAPLHRSAAASALHARQQQPMPAEKPKGGEWYLSWGYNTEKYAHTNIRFVQAGSGNDFTLQSAEMRDSRAWDIWNHPITVPEYSWRVGKFIRPNTAIELNFDHAKALLVQGQTVQVTGTLNGASVDQQLNVNDLVPKYKLNNGANFVLINLVRRFRIAGEPGRTGSVSLLGKAGGGFMVPHTENVVLGQENEPGFQYGGLGTGVEGVIRAHVFRTLYAEFSQKGFYGHYRNLHIHDGKAHQDLWAYETVISFGTTFTFDRN